MTRRRSENRLDLGKRRSREGENPIARSQSGKCRSRWPKRETHPMTSAALNKRVRYELARGRRKSGYHPFHGLTRKERWGGRAGESRAGERQNRKLKRAVNRSFEAISDSTSFGRRREMTAQEKPHWSAETTRKNTLGQPLLYPSTRATLGEGPRRPLAYLPPASSSFDRVLSASANAPR